LSHAAITVNFNKYLSLLMKGRVCIVRSRRNSKLTCVCDNVQNIWLIHVPSQTRNGLMRVSVIKSKAKSLETQRPLMKPPETSRFDHVVSPHQYTSTSHINHTGSWKQQLGLFFLIKIYQCYIYLDQSV